MGSHSRTSVLVGTLLLGVILGSIGTLLIVSDTASKGESTQNAPARFLGSSLVMGREQDNSFATDSNTLSDNPVAKLEPVPKVCVVAGVGPGLGEHIARRFATAGCRVALLARSEEKLVNVSRSIPGSKAYACDVTDAGQVKAIFSSIEAELGDVDALFYNVGGGHFRGYDNITAADFELDFRSNALGLLLTSQQVGPKMAERGHGVIGVTGATSSWRGKSSTAGFAPGKFAERGLAESLARDLGPKGVHVFHVVVDGGVSSSRSSNTAMHPEDVAETYYNLALQPRSAWTFELSLFAWADNTWYSI